MDTITARKMHRTLEAYHGQIYFSPEAGREYGALGLEDPATGYFASRAAPMGAVSADVVIATFFNFAPDYVAAAMPGAWDVAAPSDWIEARLRAVDTTLRTHLGDEVESPEMARAAELARVAADACWSAGRPLAAGLRGLDWPGPPHLALWHAISILREFRGDGHIAVLVERGVRPCEALLLHAGTGVIPEITLKATRGWADEPWSAARADLTERDLLDGDAEVSLTSTGAEFRDDIEARTDRAALDPWLTLGPAGCDELRALVRPFSRTLVKNGVFGS